MPRSNLGPIHITFLPSALAVATVDRIAPQGRAQAERARASAANDHPVG